jgi:hypothetical protein
MGTVIGAHSFLKTVIIATIKPPIPQPISKPGLMVVKVKYPVPTNSKRLIAVLFTVPFIVIFSEILPEFEKVLFDRTGFPDLKER